MSGSELKMSYIPAQFRVRLEFTKAQADSMERPPQVLVEKAKAKLIAEFTKGNLAFYRLFETRLFTVWQKLRASNDPPETTVAVTLATGAPRLPGLVVEAAENSENLAYLSFTAAAEVLNSWRFELVKLTVGKYLQDFGVTTVADPALIHTLWLRACQGEKIVKAPLRGTPAVPNSIDRKNYFHITHDNTASYVTLVVFQVRDIIDDNAIDTVVAAVMRHTQELASHNGRSYQILKERIIFSLRSAYRGPERYGLDLPVMILAAFSRAAGQGQRLESLSQPHPVPQARVAPSRRQPTPGNEQGVGPLQVEFSEDKMQAFISTHDEAIYERTDLSGEDWQVIFANLGVRYGFRPKHLEALQERLRTRKPLKNLVIAEGVPCELGEDPFLFETYREEGIKTLSNHNHISFRDRQQRRFVQTGQVIAEVRYRKPPRVGRDVVGRQLSPPNQEIPLIHYGDGVELRDNRFFVATVDGVPHFDDETLSVEQALIHKGNVNLASGNIYFRGPAEIHGNIEQGSTVHIGGDLVVNGMIEGGDIHVKGNLSVRGGIVLGKDSRIRVEGDLKAQFIENSLVYAHGKVTAQKDITASRILGAKQIIVLNEGVIAGGELQAWQLVRCGQLGRALGANTSVSLGNSDRLEHRAAILKGRHERLDAIIKDTKGSIRLLQQKRRAQTTPKDIQRKDRLHKRLDRAKELLSKVETQMHLVKESLHYNEEAVLQVSGVLSKNCQLRIAGTLIPVANEIRSVQVQKKKQKGSHMVALEEASALEESA